MRKLRGNIRHIVCYTVTTGLLENDEWISFDSEDEARHWYTSKVILSFGMTPNQFVEKLGRDKLKNWIEAKNLGSFE